MSRFKTFLFIVIAFFAASSLKAQCGDDLIASCAGTDGNVKYVKHFKIRFEESKDSKNVSQTQFSIMLTKGSHYRFSVCNDVTKPGLAIAELSSPTEKFASNVSPSSGNALKGFDFVCSKTGPYFLKMSFQDGKEGCGVCVLSIVTN